MLTNICRAVGKDAVSCPISISLEISLVTESRWNFYDHFHSCRKGMWQGDLGVLVHCPAWTCGEDCCMRIFRTFSTVSLSWLNKKQYAYLPAKRVISFFFLFFPFIGESMVLQSGFRSSYSVNTYSLVLSST